ncbi:MAG: hypothetical protein HQL08_03475 [Nitrospirae bacterium]|nr:hypothetical protein [Nitrospirota bacterium]
MLPDAVLSHTTTGRFRVKVPSRKGDAAYFSSVREHFAHFEGVEQVEINVMTSSVLIYCSDLKAVAAFAEEKALFRLRILRPLKASMAGNFTNAFSDFDKRVKRLTGDELDVPGIAFLTLLGFGIYEIGRGNFAAPAWYTAFWYALNIFLKSKPETVQEENK